MVQVTDFELGCGHDLYARAASSVHAIPDSLIDLCTDELLCELTGTPGPDREALLLNLEGDRKGCFYKPRRLYGPGFSGLPPKWTGLQRYLDLDAVEWASPSASQVCFCLRRDTCDAQEDTQCNTMAASHDTLLASPNVA
jgi:hypothetical protein